MNHPDDTGGPTRWGITERVARRYGYTGDMRSLPKEVAAEIYRRGYWSKVGGEDVAVIHLPLAAEMFDTAVNMGPYWPVAWLQRWLNVYNQKARRYADVTVDGVMGPGTLAALRAFAAHRGEDGLHVLTVSLNCSQGARYLDLAEAREANESFIFGWMSQRVKI